MKRRIKRAIRTLRSRLTKPRARTSARHLGDQARARGDWTQASDLYRRHVEAEPGDFDIWVQLGHSLKEIGRYDDAEAAYVAAGRLRPRDADLWLMRGHLARLRGDEAIAARHYAVSVSIDGNPHAAAERDRSMALAESRLTKRRMATPQVQTRHVGDVQTIIDGRLRGWAVDPDHPHQSAAVDILLDGELFETIVADGPIRREPPAGRAFDIDVSGRLNLANPTRLEARLNRTGERLSGSPFYAQIDGALAAWLARFENLAPGEHGRMRARAASQAAGASLDVLAYNCQSVTDLKDLVRRMGEQISPAWGLKVADAGYNAELTQALAEAAASDDRIVRVEAAAAASSAERLQVLAAASQTEWTVPLEAGVLPEPEMVYRLLDAASANVDLILADVVFYGQNPDSLEGYSAEPAWSNLIVDAEVRSRRLMAVRRNDVRTASLDASDPWPLAGLVKAIGSTASGVAQIPALLARLPLAHRAAPAPIADPPGDDSPLVVIIEAAEDLGSLGEQLRVLSDEIGPEGRILLVDPHPRGETARAQLKRLSANVSRTPCRPESVGRTLNMTIKSAFARQISAAASVVLVGPYIVPEAGTARRLAALQAASGAGAVSSVVLDDEGRCEGLGFIVGPGGGLAPAWVHKLPEETGANAWRTQPCSAAAFDMVALSGPAFEMVGGFDPELSGVWRDIDYCLRIGQAGFGILVEPEARVTRSGPPASASDALDQTVRRRWSARLAQDDPFYSPLYSAALNHQAGDLTHPWLAARISRRAVVKPQLSSSAPPLAAPPQEVVA